MYVNIFRHLFNIFKKRKGELIMKQLITPTELSTISNLALDASKHRYSDRYVLLYHELLSSNNCPVMVPFYVSDLKKALSMLTLKEQQKISKVFGLSGGIIHYLKDLNYQDIALQNMLIEANAIMQKLRALKFMYIYAPKVKHYIDLAVRKVWDPKEKYDTLTKIKYVSLYYVFLVNYHRLPLDPQSLKLSQETIINENNNFMLPYFIVEAYADLFAKLPDGDILIPMIDAFLACIPKDLRDTILEYSQITSDVYQYKNVTFLRNLNEQLFPNGDWMTGIDFFRLSSIKKISITQFQKGLRAYRKYFLKKEHVPTHFEKVVYGSSNKSICVYEFYKNFAVSDPQELLQYVNLFEFLDQQMPTLPLGKRMIPFCDSSLVK